MVVAWRNIMSVVHKLLKDNDQNPYCIGEDLSSDEENGAESSEDELQVLLEKERGDFEQEMHMELTSALTSSDSTNTETQMASSIQNGGKPKGTKTPGSPSQGSCSAAARCYSEDYFSSGSDDENQVGGVASKSQVRRKMRTDDDLFYDPHMDAEDETWVNEQRRSHRNRGKALVEDVSETNAGSKQNQQGSTQKRKMPTQKAPQSDAILSCPACLTTLCIDCQRHDIYHNQYRAMFVMNCCVAQDEVLRYDEPKHRHLGNNRKKQKTGKLVASQTLQSDSHVTSLGDGPLETYYPVKCAECSTEVAVYDEDEVYHFFNVLTSHA